MFVVFNVLHVIVIPLHTCSHVHEYRKLNTAYCTVIRTGSLCGFSLGVRTEAQTKKRSRLASKHTLPAMSHCALLKRRAALVK
jgi:hypothetical protein